MPFWIFHVFYRAIYFTFNNTKGELFSHNDIFIWGRGCLTKTNGLCNILQSVSKKVDTIIAAVAAAATIIMIKKFKLLLEPYFCTFIFMLYNIVSIFIYHVSSNFFNLHKKPKKTELLFILFNIWRNFEIQSCTPSEWCIIAWNIREEPHKLKEFCKGEVNFSDTRAFMTCFLSLFPRAVGLNCVHLTHMFWKILDIFCY